MNYLPTGVSCWVDDLGFLYVGPLPGGPPGKPYLRFDGINYRLRADWTWTWLNMWNVAPYPFDKANTLLDMYVEHALNECKP